jgi:hypothetical protein
MGGKILIAKPSMESDGIYVNCDYVKGSGVIAGYGASLLNIIESLDPNWLELPVADDALIRVSSFILQGYFATTEVWVKGGVGQIDVAGYVLKTGQRIELTRVIFEAEK